MIDDIWGILISVRLDYKAYHTRSRQFGTKLFWMTYWFEIEEVS